MNHPYKTYAKITLTDLKANYTRMNQPYDPNHLFELLIEQIQNTTDFAAHAGISYSQPQILATVYDLVLKTGVFSRNLCNWRRKPAANKTWADFKPFMTERYTEWRQEHVNTAGQQFGSANAATNREPDFAQ